MKIEKGMIVTLVSGGIDGYMECTEPADYEGMVSVKEYGDTAKKSEWMHAEYDLRQVLPAEIELRQRFAYCQDAMDLSEQALDSQEWPRARDHMEKVATQIQLCITDAIYLSNAEVSQSLP